MEPPFPDFTDQNIPEAEIDAQEREDAAWMARMWECVE